MKVRDGLGTVYYHTVISRKKDMGANNNNQKLIQKL